MPQEGVYAATRARRPVDPAAAEGGKAMSRRQFLSLLPALPASVAVGATLALLPGCTRAALTPHGAAQRVGPGHDRALLRIGALDHFTERQLLPLTLWLGTTVSGANRESAQAAELERRKRLLNSCLWLLAVRGADAPTHFFDHPQSGRVGGGVRLVVTDTGDPWINAAFPALSLDAGFGAATTAQVTLPRAGAQDSQRPRVDATVALFFDRAVAIDPRSPEVPAATALAQQLDGALLAVLAAAFDDRTPTGGLPTPTAVAQQAQQAARAFSAQKLAAAQRAGSPAAVKSWAAAVRREAAKLLDQPPAAFINVVP